MPSRRMPCPGATGRSTLWSEHDSHSLLCVQLLTALSCRSEHFNPPLSPEDRLKGVLLPLLETLGRGSPDMVDMVEVGIGAWDLGMFRVCVSSHHSLSG